MKYPTRQRITLRHSTQARAVDRSLHPIRSIPPYLLVYRYRHPGGWNVLASSRSVALKESPCGFTHFLTENLYSTGTSSTCKVGTRTTSLMISFECFFLSQTRHWVPVLGKSGVTPNQLSPVVVSVIDTLQGLPISPSNAPSDDRFVFVYPAALFQPMADHVTHGP